MSHKAQKYFEEAKQKYFDIVFEHEMLSGSERSLISCCMQVCLISNLLIAAHEALSHQEEQKLVNLAAELSEASSRIEELYLPEIMGRYSFKKAILEIVAEVRGLVNLLSAPEIIKGDAYLTAHAHIENYKKKLLALRFPQPASACPLFNPPPVQLSLQRIEGEHGITLVLPQKKELRFDNTTVPTFRLRALIEADDEMAKARCQDYDRIVIRVEPDRSYTGPPIPNEYSVPIEEDLFNKGKDIPIRLEKTGPCDPFVISIQAFYRGRGCDRPAAQPLELLAIPVGGRQLVDLKYSPTGRYCTMRGDVCEEDFVTIDEKSCFLAYPFEEKVREIMEALKIYLTNIGYKVELPVHPVDPIGSRNIFCVKICPKICTTQHTIAEWTIPNENVMFELGYATANQRIVTRLRNKAWGDYWKKEDIFRSEEWLGYSTLEEIEDKFKSYKIDTPYQCICGPCDREISEDVDAYVLIPWSYNELETSILKPNILETLCANGLEKIEFSDTRDVEHNCRKLRGAKYVIGVFPEDQEDGSHIVQRAGVAFFLGLAAGFGKRVILLQKTPVTREVFDLLKVLNAFENMQKLRTTLAKAIEKLER
jgi:hypothetical protein